MSENPEPGREPDQPSPEMTEPAFGQEEKHESAMEDVPPAPTWPIQVPDPAAEQAPPPVGMNWGAVAEQVGIELRTLQHDGSIVLAGEYFPEAGYIIDPATFRARFVDVGQIALRHTYFLGELALRDWHGHLPLEQESEEAAHPVIPSHSRGPIIGLFRDEAQARRAQERILQGSLGTGFSIQEGPLGVELRVELPELGGRVASVIAAHSGAVISIDGAPVSPPESGEGVSATGRTMVGEQADTRREGTGVSSDTQAPAREWGGSEESRST